jgi:hypothetical protein
MPCIARGENGYRAEDRYGTAARQCLIEALLPAIKSAITVRSTAALFAIISIATFPTNAQTAPAAPASTSTQSASQAPAQQPTSAAPAKPKLEFNLSSTVPQILASHHHDFQLAEITIAGTTKTIIPTDLLTPAEYVALHQVLLSGTQLVQLGEKGNATGGRFKIDPALSAAIQDLANAAQTDSGANSTDTATASSSPEDKDRLKQRNTVASPTLAEEEFIEVGGTSRVITGAAVIVGKKKRSRQPGH